MRCACAFSRVAVSDIVGVSAGFDEGAMSLAGGDGKSKPLSAGTGFTSGLSEVSPGMTAPAWIMYFDNDVMMSIVDRATQMFPSPQSEKWPKIKDALGLGGMHRVVVVGGFDGRLRAFRATDGAELWSTSVGGKILGPPVVIGNLVFFSTLSGRTYALRATDGELRWRIPIGRYSPVIATDETYYFSLNGRMIATGGRDGPPSRVR